MRSLIKIKHSADQELRKQVYAELRRLIIEQRLSPGQRLPSSRLLAEDIGVSRKTVKEAYQQLVAEGFIETRDRSGTFVRALSLQTGRSKSKCAGQSIEDRLSTYATRIGATANTISSSTSDISFFSWQPTFSPPSGSCSGVFLSEVRRFLDSPEPVVHPFGLRSLREEIADWVARTREIRCTPEQVAIVTGYGQALDLITRMHTGPGDVVAIENPTYPPARDILTSYGASLAPISVDAEGLLTEELFRTRWKGPCKTLIVTPAHQFPMGCVLSLQRRVDLLDWAEATGCVIVEDDFDAEFNFQTRPVPAMAAMDQAETIVHLGSFKKILPASFCLDFLIIPQRLVPHYERALWLSAGQHSPATQSGLAALLRTRQLDKQSRRMKAIYRKRREVLLTEVSRQLAGLAEIVADNVGLHVVIRLSTGTPDDVFVKRSAAAGVELISTTALHAVQVADTSQFILGYASLTEDEITEGIRRLAKLLKNAPKSSKNSAKR